MTLGLTFEDDVTDEDLLVRWQGLIAQASGVLWRASEGQLFIGRCTLEDRAGWGELRVPHGAMELEVLASGASFELSSPGRETWSLRVPGRPADDEETVMQLAAHIARGVFGLDPHPASDAAAGPGCLLAGTGTRLCADDEPRLARRACRSVVGERWQGLATFPNPGWSVDEPAPRTAFERLRESP